MRRSKNNNAAVAGTNSHLLAIAGFGFNLALVLYLGNHAGIIWWGIGYVAYSAHNRPDPWGEEPQSLAAAASEATVWATLWPYCLFVYYLSPLIRRK